MDLVLAGRLMDKSTTATLPTSRIVEGQDTGALTCNTTAAFASIAAAPLGIILERALA
jgi:hypothetical protein